LDNLLTAYSDPGLRTGLCLFPPVALQNLMNFIGQLEIQVQGLTSETMKLELFNYTPSKLYMTMFYSLLLWSAVYYYIDQTNPYQTGSHRPFYFLFTKSFWMEMFGMPPKLGDGKVAEEVIQKQTSSLEVRVVVVHFRTPVLNR
jgi:hypothetical protein